MAVIYEVFMCDTIDTPLTLEDLPRPILSWLPVMSDLPWVESHAVLPYDGIWRIYRLTRHLQQTSIDVNTSGAQYNPTNRVDQTHLTLYSLPAPSRVNIPFFGWHEGVYFASRRSRRMWHTTWPVTYGPSTASVPPDVRRSGVLPMSAQVPWQ